MQPNATAFLIYYGLIVYSCQNLNSEFSEVLSNGKILYGQDPKANSYFAEMEKKMNSANRKNKIYKVIAYVLVLFDLYCLTLAF